MVDSLVKLCKLTIFKRFLEVTLHLFKMSDILADYKKHQFEWKLKVTTECPLHYIRLATSRSALKMPRVLVEGPFFFFSCHT